MKKLVFLSVLAVGIAFASSASAQIAGTKHDFSAAGYGTTEICQPCHTPHDADISVAISPLWNHTLASSVGYTLYTSTTLTATMAQPSGISTLCLSCHDGTVAVDSFGGATGTNFIVPGPGFVGKDLRSEHPISFTYDTALATADGGLHDPATYASGLGGTVNADLLFGGSLECASCHDVHNAVVNPSLLRKDNTGSALCLTCHNK